MSINRTSWKKGRSGNPRGRPRSGDELGAILRQLVDRKRFAEKLCELCYAGDIQAMRLLLAYTDGPPQGRLESDFSTEGIQITVTYVQQNNQLAITSPAPGAGSDSLPSETVQRGLLRAPVGQDGPGNGPVDSPGTAR